jgi:hypothetical protein
MSERVSCPPHSHPFCGLQKEIDTPFDGLRMLADAFVASAGVYGLQEWGSSK